MGDDGNQAVVLRLAEGRFFCGFGKKGQVLTAWSLAGARLFGTWRVSDLARVERRLAQRGKAFRRMVVGLRDVP